jgi:hydroxymethylbilane synthase
MSKTIKIGTRGSKLALYQANLTKQILESHFPEYTFVPEIIHTKGDKILDVALSKIGDKGLFTKEIEVALSDGRIDMAVHSMKDLPTLFPEGLKLGAVLQRGEPREALVSNGKRKLSELTEKDIIATSSVRRKAQLLKINPRFHIVDIRGNVDTRVKKWKSGYCDAMIMAATGLQRLGLDENISELVNPSLIMPPPAQGIIAIESRENDTFIDELLLQINHKETWIRGRAEYTFLETIQGGCQVPIACYSEINGKQLNISGMVLSPDGKQYLSESVQCAFSEISAVETARNLATSFLERGALKIIAGLEK